MGSEVKSFSFRLGIKDKKSEEIIELSKSDDLKVIWNGSLGEAKKVVVLEKNDKKYQVAVKIGLKKYLLGARHVVEDGKFLAPASVPYEVYGGYMGEPNNSPEKDIERQHYAKLTNQGNVGRIIFFLIIIIIIAAIFVLLGGKKRKNLKKR